MGTNYYAHINTCPHCDRPEKIIHIGKSSHGWVFGFHATDEIRSWAEWKKILGAYGTTIVDEYGEKHSFLEFCDLVEQKQSEKLRIAVEIKNDPYGHYVAQSYFTDSEGYDFCSMEFS